MGSNPKGSISNFDQKLIKLGGVFGPDLGQLAVQIRHAAPAALAALVRVALKGAALRRLRRAAGSLAADRSA